MTLKTTAVWILTSAAVSIGYAQTREPDTLQIYVLDVEGGNATLFVAPSGESVLIDTGNIAPGAVRDAERIMAATKDAGITRIDHLITTHWHGDHFGGMEELASRIPIGQFIDHGLNVQPSDAADGFLNKVYPQLYAKGTHTVVKAGDTLRIARLHWRIVSGGGATLTHSLPGAGKSNPACAATRPKDPDPTENSQSIGSVVTFGRFRVVYLGDLYWNKEIELMCPANRLGLADLFIVSHHGQDRANSPALVHALHPRAAIMNNGTRKGGQPDVMKVLFSSPGLQDLWQMHFSLLSGQEYTVPGAFIANRVDDEPSSMPKAPIPPPAPGASVDAPPVHNGPAFWFKVAAHSDGRFSITNSRNGFTKTYAR